jgi:hypothetical protein
MPDNSATNNNNSATNNNNSATNNNNSANDNNNSATNNNNSATNNNNPIDERVVAQITILTQGFKKFMKLWNGNSKTVDNYYIAIVLVCVSELISLFLFCLYVYHASMGTAPPQGTGFVFALSLIGMLAVSLVESVGG